MTFFLMTYLVDFREERSHIKLPWDVKEAKALGRVLEKHKDRNYYEVLAAIVVTYILYPSPIRTFVCREQNQFKPNLVIFNT